jgi:hypothetical protein
MDEARLQALRRDPSPEFAERLRARLREQSESTAAAGGRWPLRRVAAGAAAMAAVALLFTVPAVRASAESFLAMFRVVNFVALEVDGDRLKALQSQQLDVPQLIGERLEVLEAPGPAVAVVSAEQAGAAAGIDVREPSYLPRLPSSAGTRTALVRIEVEGQHSARVTADADRLRQVMDILGIVDLQVPEGLHGQVVTVRIPPVVTMQYEQAIHSVSLMQAAKPEVLLPAGVNLPALGEIGLRILGLPVGEARQFAQAIDWQSTLLVPVPPAATSFRQVDVNGAQGVAIERTETTPTDGTPRNVHLFLWSANNMVFVLEGTFAFEEMLQMAQSVR